MDQQKRPRSGLVQEHGLSIAVIGAAVIALSTGWSLFTERLSMRANRHDEAEQEVARIWGGPLSQPQPEVRWRRADAATVDLERGDLASTDVQVDLDLDYRRRGVVEYPGYDAAFNANWSFVNPSPEPSFVAFSIGLPAERRVLSLRDVRLLVDGKEDAANTEYAADRIVWRGKVDGAKTARISLAYRARGLSRFGYRLTESTNEENAPLRPITAFKLAIRAKNLRGPVDFPVGSMSPTTVVNEKGASVFTWDVERVLTSFDVGIALSDRREVEGALGRLIRNAPWFYLLFAGALLFAFADSSRRARALHVAGLSAVYFLYFPLAVYLSAYLAWPVAATMSLGGAAALALLHAQTSAGPRAALRTGLALLFFLAVPAVAYLLPAHTGLILVIAGFISLGVALHYLGQIARRLPADAAEPAAPEAAPCAS